MAVVPVAPPKALPREGGPVSSAVASLLMAKAISGRRTRLTFVPERCGNYDCQHQKAAHEAGAGPCTAKPCRTSKAGCQKFETRKGLGS